jgi:hypothetical protein
VTQRETARERDRSARRSLVTRFSSGATAAPADAAAPRPSDASPITHSATKTEAVNTAHSVSTLTPPIKKSFDIDVSPIFLPIAVLATA